MATKSYQKWLEGHLTAYKVNRLGVLECGTYSHRGLLREYGHILPQHLAWLNIPEPFRKEVQDFVASKGVVLHRYFHHLNSSQAFTLALFVPYLLRAPQILAMALGVRCMEQWDLERIVDDIEGTNVDVWWRSKDGSETYCEVKLSETSFGTAENDAEHHRKLNVIYRQELERHLDARILEPRTFFRNYQILRNLWLAARQGRESDRVLFLLPRANHRPVSQLRFVLTHVRPQLKRRTKVMFIEDLLDRLTRKPRTREYRWYGELLAEKYLVS